MTQTVRARVFRSGREQHVTIPAEFRFHSDRVAIRRDPETGAVILSEIPDIEEVYAALDAAELPADFMGDQDRDRRTPEPGNNEI